MYVVAQPASARVSRSESIKTETGCSVTDSGVDSGAKLSPTEGTTPVKKNVSVAHGPDAMYVNTSTPQPTCDILFILVL